MWVLCVLLWYSQMAITLVISLSFMSLLHSNHSITYTHTQILTHSVHTPFLHTHAVPTLFHSPPPPASIPPLSRLYNDRINLFIKMTPLQAMLHDRIMARMSSGGSGLMRAFKYFGNTGGSNIDVKGFSHGCSMVGLLITPEERVR